MEIGTDLDARAERGQDDDLASLDVAEVLLAALVDLDEVHVHLVHPLHTRTRVSLNYGTRATTLAQHSYVAISPQSAVFQTLVSLFEDLDDVRVHLIHTLHAHIPVQLSHTTQTER